MLGAIASVVPGTILIHPLGAIVLVEIVPLPLTQVARFGSTIVP